MEIKEITCQECWKEETDLQIYLLFRRKKNSYNYILSRLNRLRKENMKEIIGITRAESKQILKSFYNKIYKLLEEIK